jgi:hypothetical protein
MKTVFVLCSLLLVALVTTGAAPTKPPTTPFGYSVQAVAQEYQYISPAINGFFLKKPPIRIEVTTTDLMGGAPTELHPQI